MQAPPTDWDEITIDNLLSPATFKYLYAFDEPSYFLKVKLMYQQIAKKLGIEREFKSCVKQYELLYRPKPKENSKVTFNEIGDKLLQEEKILNIEGDLCIYNKNGVYERDMAGIEKKVLNILPDANTYLRKEVWNYLLLKSTEVKFDREFGYINFKNGLFSIKDREIIPHTSDIITLNQIPHNYNPNIQVHELLKDTLMKIACHKEDRYKTILQMIGYCMTTSVHLQKCFVLYGKTAGNGKSTLQNIIADLVGHNNITAIALDELTNNKFASSSIKGKLIDMGSEMTKDYLKDVSSFKQWVTGDEITIEEKFKSKQRINPYAKFIFNANELPKVADKTDGFYRRLHIILMEAQFNKMDNKNFKFSDIVSEEAMEWLLKESLQAFLDMDDFANADESERIISSYRVENNSTLMYMNDIDRLNAMFNVHGYRFSRVLLHADYVTWCRLYGYQPLGRNTFYSSIENIEGIEFKKIKGRDLIEFSLEKYKNY